MAATLVASPCMTLDADTSTPGQRPKGPGPRRSTTMRHPRRLVAALFLFSSLSALAQGRPQPPTPSPAPQQEATWVNPSTRTLRVEGMGEVKAEPDEAYIDLAMETLAPTAKAAAEENAKRMEKVVTALTQAGVPRKEI